MKLQKISTTVSPFAGISFVHNEFVKVGMSHLIDNELGSRVKTVGFTYSDINKLLRSRADEVFTENIFLSKQSFGEFNPNEIKITAPVYLIFHPPC